MHGPACAAHPQRIGKPFYRPPRRLKLQDFRHVIQVRTAPSYVTCAACGHSTRYPARRQDVAVCEACGHLNVFDTGRQGWATATPEDLAILSFHDLSRLRRAADTCRADRAPSNA